MEPIRFAFAGDRDIAVRVLEYINQSDVKPLALLLSSSKQASHAHELRDLCPHLGNDAIFQGTTFRRPNGINYLRQLKLDYIIAVHFPYIFTNEILDIPKVGIINLHPAFLPFNRGWHTPSWSILENTSAGATCHFMDNSIDTGDIIGQEKLEVALHDTANSLYQRIKELEFEVFTKCWPQILHNSFKRKQQNVSTGTTHARSDLFTPKVQKIDLEELVRTGDLLQKLRGLTTNNIKESAYFEYNGKRYHVQVQIYQESIDDPTEC